MRKTTLNLEAYAEVYRMFTVIEFDNKYKSLVITWGYKNACEIANKIEDTDGEGIKFHWCSTCDDIVNVIDMHGTMSFESYNRLMNEAVTYKSSNMRISATAEAATRIIRERLDSKVKTAIDGNLVDRKTGRPNGALLPDQPRYMCSVTVGKGWLYTGGQWLNNYITVRARRYIINGILGGLCDSFINEKKTLAGMTFDHLNGESTDDRLSNLEYVTLIENIRRRDARLNWGAGQ